MTYVRAGDIESPHPCFEPDLDDEGDVAGVTPCINCGGECCIATDHFRQCSACGYAQTD